MSARSPTPARNHRRSISGSLNPYSNYIPFIFTASRAPSHSMSHAVRPEYILKARREHGAAWISLSPAPCSVLLHPSLSLLTLMGGRPVSPSAHLLCTTSATIPYFTSAGIATEILSG